MVKAVEQRQHNPGRRADPLQRGVQAGRLGGHQQDVHRVDQLGDGRGCALKSPSTRLVTVKPRRQLRRRVRARHDNYAGFGTGQRGGDETAHSARPQHGDLIIRARLPDQRNVANAARYRRSAGTSTARPPWSGRRTGTLDPSDERWRLVICDRSPGPDDAPRARLVHLTVDLPGGALASRLSPAAQPRCGPRPTRRGPAAAP